MSVFLAAHELDLDDRLAVAAANGPTSTTVSGDVEALAELKARCDADGVRARMVPVDYASPLPPHGGDARRRCSASTAGVRPRAAEIPLFSTVTADWLDTTTMDADYWYTNLRRTVRFDEAVRALADQGFGTFIEVSPHPVLTVPTQETLDAQNSPASVLGSLRRDEGGLGRFLTSLGQAFANGVPVDWRLDGPAVELPTYPFQRQRYWPTPAAPATPPRGRPARRRLLGGRRTRGPRRPGRARPRRARRLAARAGVLAASPQGDLGGRRAALRHHVEAAHPARPHAPRHLARRRRRPRPPDRGGAGRPRRRRRGRRPRRRPDRRPGTGRRAVAARPRRRRPGRDRRPGPQL